MRLSLALPAVAVAALCVIPVTAASSDITPSTTSVPAEVPTTVPVPPNQQLPPGAVKHPGERCGTVIQPPELQGCPGPPADPGYCTGDAYAIGECTAAEAGFFNPPDNFQPRNGTEACISWRESNDTYYPPMHGYYGRWQMSSTLWAEFGGMDDWGGSSPAEQDHVFVSVVAAENYQPWQAFDGCT